MRITGVLTGPLLASAPFCSRSRMEMVAVTAPLELAQSLGGSYSAALAARPILTNVVTAMVLSGISDVIAQRVAPSQGAVASGGRGLVGPKRRSLDVKRVWWMLVWGAAVPGYFCHYWFKFLAHLFPSEGMTLLRAVKKVFVNQLFMSPGLNAGFFAFVLLTRGDDRGSTLSRSASKGLNGETPPSSFTFWERYRAKLATDLWPTILRSCGYWGVVQLVNFRFVPEMMTQLYTNVAFLIWTVYVSIVGHRRVETKRQSVQDSIRLGGLPANG